LINSFVLLVFCYDLILCQLANSLNWVGLRVLVAWIGFKKVVGVEDEVEGFQAFAGFLKKVPQENLSIFFH
jgi:hypothetical protein